MADSTRSGFPLCYGCGQENPIGFKLKVRQENEETLASFTPGPYHSGFTEKVHGGVLCALLDEVMVYLPFLQGLKSVTGKMEVHFRRPARPGEPLQIRGRVLKQRHRAIQAQGIITNGAGEVVAEGQALLYILGKYEEA
jgi:uncharacterized protein (TIGR00369 family)